MFEGEFDEDHLGFSVRADGNWNGDTQFGSGIPDILIGGGNRLDAGNPPFVIDFAALVLSPHVSTYPAPNVTGYIRIEGEQVADRFGWSAIFPGDVDQDGRDDIAVSSVRGPFDPNDPFDPWLQTGRVYVFLSNDPGTGFAPGTITQGVVSASQASVIIAGEVVGDRLGYSLARVGDWDEDGSPDFVSGAPGGWRSSPLFPGHAYVISGAKVSQAFDDQAQGGPQVVSVLDVLADPLPSHPDLGPGEPDGHADPNGAIFAGDVGEDRFGFSAAYLGESGDTEEFNDFIIGAPEFIKNPPLFEEASNGTGYVKVFLSNGAHPIRIDGENEGDEFGIAVGGRVQTALNPTGLTLDRAVVGAIGWEDPQDEAGDDTGKVYVFDPVNPQPPLLEYFGVQTGEGFGRTVTGIGDMDGGGLRDLAVASWEFSVNPFVGTPLPCTWDKSQAPLGGRGCGRLQIFSTEIPSPMNIAEYHGEEGRDSLGWPTTWAENLGPNGEEPSSCHLPAGRRT